MYGKITVTKIEENEDQMCKAYGTNRPVTNLFNYKSKQVHNERTEAYLFLIKNLLIT